MKQATAAEQASDQADQATTPMLASSFDIAGTTLTSEEFDLFAGLGRMRRVDAGQVLFRRGELGTTMYVIAQGSIDLGAREAQLVDERVRHRADHTASPPRMRPGPEAASPSNGPREHRRYHGAR